MMPVPARAMGILAPEAVASRRGVWRILERGEPMVKQRIASSASTVRHLGKTDWTPWSASCCDAIQMRLRPHQQVVTDYSRRSHAAHVQLVLRNNLIFPPSLQDVCLAILVGHVNMAIDIG